MISYEEIINDLERERGLIFDKAKEGKISEGVALGATAVLSKLINKYEEDFEDLMNNE